jgi:hypothetical protein
MASTSRWKTCRSLPPSWSKEESPAEEQIARPPFTSKTGLRRSRRLGWSRPTNRWWSAPTQPSLGRCCCLKRLADTLVGHFYRSEATRWTHSAHRLIGGVHEFKPLLRLAFVIVIIAVICFKGNRRSRTPVHPTLDSAERRGQGLALVWSCLAADC